MAATALLETLDVAEHADFERWDDDLYEIVDGQRTETPPMSYFAGLLSTDLSLELGAYIRQQSPQPGHLAVEVLFRIPLTIDTSRKRRPDIAFVASERWPIDRPKSPRDDAWDVVPDLAVEVVSPTDFASNLLAKVGEYFQAGVRLVWVVYPVQRCIHVFEAWDRIQVVTESGLLDGGAVLPGFRLALDRLFGPIAPADGSA
jgi:Uma2 family endonuclease